MAQGTKIEALVKTGQEATDRVEAVRHRLHEADFYWHSPRLREASAELDAIETDLRTAWTAAAHELGQLPDCIAEDERLEVLERAIRGLTGWTESVEVGEAVNVRLPGGLWITAERHPD